MKNLIIVIAIFISLPVLSQTIKKGGATSNQCKCSVKLLETEEGESFGEKTVTRTYQVKAKSGLNPKKTQDEVTVVYYTSSKKYMLSVNDSAFQIEAVDATGTVEEVVIKHLGEQGMVDSVCRRAYQIKVKNNK